MIVCSSKDLMSFYQHFEAIGGNWAGARGRRESTFSGPRMTVASKRKGSV